VSLLHAPKAIKWKTGGKIDPDGVILNTRLLVDSVVLRRTDHSIDALSVYLAALVVDG
jgi:hypothetical protein